MHKQNWNYLRSLKYSLSTLHQCNEPSEESGLIHRRLVMSPSILHIIFLGAMLHLLPIASPSLCMQLCSCQLLLSPELSQTFPYVCFLPILTTPVPDYSTPTGPRFRKVCKLWKLEGICASPLAVVTLWSFAHLKFIFLLQMSGAPEWSIWYFVTWSSIFTVCTHSTSGGAEVLTFISESF